MTSILLHDYVRQVDKLIDDNRLVEAIEHCRHILHSYPRHIDTYRVMGKALLEKQEFDAASDLFLRILSADPNDFISHVGLSIIYKEEQQYDQALWHLERAYEIQPYNVAIQGELRQLYADQSDARPGIIPLTPGALARLYMQGELYQQAIAELRRILAADPGRMDLQVLLAEAYWRDDQRIDAEEVCLKVLSELPNCIVLNAILSEIWLQTGRIPEAQKYLQRLQGLTQQTKHALDKETIAGEAFATEGAFPLPEQATLEFLETGMAMPTEPAVPTDDWVGEVQFDQPDEDSLDGVVLEPESGMHSYDWLADIGETEEGETAVPGQVDSETDWFSQDKAKDELNISTGELNAEWLADLRGDDDEADFQPLDLEDTVAKTEAPDNTVESDWFRDENEASDEQTAVLHDEVDDWSPQAETTTEADEEAFDWLDALADDEPALQIDSTNLMDENLLDWGAEDEENVESEPHVVQEPKTPFWLSEMTDEELEAAHFNPEEALDWLGEEEDEAEAPEMADSELNTAETAAQPEAPIDQEAESITPEMDDLGEVDDWLAELTEGEIDSDPASATEEDSEIEEPAETIQLDATMDELSALSDANDWMASAAADPDTFVEPEEEEFPNLAIPELEGDDLSEIPDWLDSDDSDLSEESEAAVSSENDPQITPQPEEPQDKPAKDQEKEDAFDWLDDLTPESADIPSEPPIDTEGMPSWMAAADDDESVEVVDEWDSQSADIPGWLQEPVELSDLDLSEESLEDGEADEDDALGLTGLLAEMEATDEALPLENLNDMDSLFSDWVDEDDDSSLAELVDELEGEVDAPVADFSTGEESWEETAVPDQPEQADAQEEPEEVGLTGLLANLNMPDVESDSEMEETGDDFLADFLTDADEVDLDDFLSDEDDTLETAAEQDDALSLDELDLENVSLTQLLSEADVPQEPAEMDPVSDADEDAWFSELADMTDAETESEPHAEEEEAGLTGMLANLWSDEERDAADALHSLEDEAADEMSLTELLAGIDYAEDAVDSEVDLPDFDLEASEPPVTEVLPESDEEDEELPVSAEDTTWLMQLEEDTGSLAEQADEFDMAEETGLDWLTTPDEPEAAEAEVDEEIPVAEETEAEDTEQDGAEEDWDDAMSWLEELAAQQDEPVAELPSVAETMLDEELEPPAEVESTLEEESDLDWLAELTEGEIAADLDVADEASQAELPEQVEEEDQFGLDDLASDEELSWLDELSTGRLESSVSEEPETVAEPVEELEPSDIDDDSWLDELALTDESDEGALPDFDDLPETLDEAEELADLSLAVSEPDLDWLDTAVEEPEELAEEIETAVPDEEEQKPLSDEDYKVIGVTDALKESSGIEEAEADLEEALAWLDELGEEGEAEPADEAPPTLITPTSHDEAPDEEPEPDELALALDRLAQQVLDEGVTVPETAVSPLSLSTAELNDVLDWIEQVEAAKTVETEAVAEEPSAEEPVAETAAVVEESDSEAEMDLAAMSEDPEAWLEQLLSGDVDMDVEMEPPPIKPSDDAVYVTDDAAAAADVAKASDSIEDDEAEADSLLDDLTLDEMPEDPDAAVAWLDQLASGDDEFDVEMEPAPLKPGEDAVDGTSDAPEVEADQQDPLEPAEAEESAELSLEDDPEAWLERLLGDEMSLDVDMEPPPIKPSEDAVYVTDDVVGLETEPELTIEPDAADEAIEEADEAIEKEVSKTIAEVDEDETAEFNPEDDPEAWLEQMLGDEMSLDVDMEPPPIRPSEDAMFVTDDARLAEPSEEGAAVESEMPEAGIESEESDTDIIADVPDDPDEAMAWLEQLAARQGADLEELPSVRDAEAEPEMPDWMAQDLAELTAEPDLEPAETDEVEDAAEETAVGLDASEIRAEVEDIDEELPDWLDEEPRGRLLGQTDWLRALPEVDVDTWLSAEEEATITGSTDEIILPDTGPLTSRPEMTPTEEEIDEDALFDPVMEPSSGAYNVDEAKLTMAQQSLADGRINEAINQFKELVAAGSGMMSVIAELEQAAEAHPQTPALAQILGDAYMRNGQLQKALASYRFALDQM